MDSEALYIAIAALILLTAMLVAFAFIYERARKNGTAWPKRSTAQGSGSDKGPAVEAWYHRSFLTLGPYPYGCGGYANVHIQYDAMPVVTLILQCGEHKVALSSNDEFWIHYFNEKMVKFTAFSSDEDQVILANRKVLFELTEHSRAFCLSVDNHEMTHADTTTPADLVRVMYPGYSHFDKL
jgi:hypothetical protein